MSSNANTSHESHTPHVSQLQLNIAPQLQMAAMQKYFPFHLIPDCPQRVLVGQHNKYRNPFRPDNTPGCHFDWDKNNRLLFFDFATDKFYAGDCIQVIMRRFSMSFKDALKLVQNDSELQMTQHIYTQEIIQHRSNMSVIDASSTPFTPHTSTSNIDKEPEIKWRVVTRNWNNEDDKFWLDRYGISVELRDRYNIRAVSRAYKTMFLGCETQFYSYVVGAGDPCYCYTIDDRVKFYRPYNKRFKWIGNVRKENVQGYAQLPESGEVLVIAASLKDALCLIAIGINAIAPQSETTFIPENVLDELKGRFKHIVVLFDLDEAGTSNARKYSEKYKLGMLELPRHIGIEKQAGKDVADFRENLGADEFEYGMHALIEGYLGYLSHIEQVDRQTHI